MKDRDFGSPGTPFPELFPARDLTSEERAAHDEDPRPGSCFTPRTGVSRRVSQSDTDLLIRVELWSRAPASARAMFEELMGIPRWRPGAITDPMVPTTYQRGGIDSDPFVRLLAYRAWGNRDRGWFEERGVRSGELVAAVDGGLRGFWVACAWPGETVIGRAASDAWPGELVEIAKRPGAPRDGEIRVADRLRVEPRGQSTTR
ncbi:MAG TPA: hypothetical protein VFT22_11305 [Kofleriaceae bacterium]|nr:hypothetical protein [Kofleriaceae bacterium]